MREPPQAGPGGPESSVGGSGGGPGPSRSSLVGAAPAAGAAVSLIAGLTTAGAAGAAAAAGLLLFFLGLVLLIAAAHLLSKGGGSALRRLPQQRSACCSLSAAHRLPVPRLPHLTCAGRSSSVSCARGSRSAYRRAGSSPITGARRPLNTTRKASLAAARGAVEGAAQAVRAAAGGSKQPGAEGRSPRGCGGPRAPSAHRLWRQKAQWRPHSQLLRSALSTTGKSSKRSLRSGSARRHSSRLLVSTLRGGGATGALAAEPLRGLPACVCRYPAHLPSHTSTPPSSDCSRTSAAAT